MTLPKYGPYILSLNSGRLHVKLLKQLRVPITAEAHEVFETRN